MFVSCQLGNAGQSKVFILYSLGSTFFYGLLFTVVVTHLTGFETSERWWNKLRLRKQLVFHDWHEINIQHVYDYLCFLSRNQLHERCENLELAYYNKMGWRLVISSLGKKKKILTFTQFVLGYSRLFHLIPRVRIGIRMPEQVYRSRY